MVQHDIDYFMNDKNEVGLSSKQINGTNEIVEVGYENEIYKTWKVEFIRPLVVNFLKQKYPNSVIIRELNSIDLTILDERTDEIIPVEIQRTVLSSNKTFKHSHFEDRIRRQLEDNIENCGKCWLFIDSEYLRFLQSGNLRKNISMNMTWLIESMKENKLKVFAIKYDGTVKELITKDFDFLKNVSQTCSIGYDNDERILNRNKLKIYRNIRIGYNFTQEEIDKFYKEFDNREDKKDEMGSSEFFTKSSNERCKLYGNILHSVRELPCVNICMDMNSGGESKFKFFAMYLGIFEIVGNYASGSTGHNMKFIDKFDVCKYFPGYLRQEKHWLTYKGNEMDGKTFSNMCRGFYKNAKTMFDY